MPRIASALTHIHMQLLSNDMNEKNQEGLFCNLSSFPQPDMPRKIQTLMNSPNYRPPLVLNS